MSQTITFNAFNKQSKFLLDNHRTKGAFAGKRGGKTELGAIQAINYQEQKPGFKPNGIDPYLGIIAAPTERMLRRLSLKKFLAYGKGFVKDHNKSTNEIIWHDNKRTPGGSEVIGVSAEKPERSEGLKANWVWLDEVFQMKEQFFLEMMARVADNQGYLFCTGSLGIQYVNPKQHWAYKHFKQNPGPNTVCFEWATAENPYFPEDELVMLKENLNPQVFRQMFEICWDVQAENAVYGDLDEGNVTRGYVYNENLETYISIDWGWAHPMACLFFQYDRAKDIVYLFDEIVMSNLKLDKLLAMILSKPYKIKGYCCDIAGNQEREQTAISNVKWFKENANIKLKYKTCSIQKGIAFVRSYIKNGLGQSKFIIDEVRCPKSLDSLKQYKYPVKNGIIVNENPEKLMDDPSDAVRYFYENFIRPVKPLVYEIG